MPRKNRARRSKPQAPRKQVQHPRVRTTVVKPVGRCPLPHRKYQFATEEIAAEALEQARIYKVANGNTGHLEQRYYLCPECGLYHLTSRKVWVELEKEEPS